MLRHAVKVDGACCCADSGTVSAIDATTGNVSTFLEIRKLFQHYNCGLGFDNLEPYTVLAANVPTGIGISTIAVHGNYLYLQFSGYSFWHLWFDTVGSTFRVPACRQSDPEPNVQRWNLTSRLPEGSVATNGFVCTEFGFDDELFGSDTILCLGAQSFSYSVRHWFFGLCCCYGLCHRFGAVRCTN